jgi:hypothetical protein
MKAEVRCMTELDRVRIVERMFPDWKEHLNDRKTIDRIMKGLRCSPGRTVSLRRYEKRQEPTSPATLAEQDAAVACPTQLAN